MIEFTKMHGIGNDFIVIGDFDDRIVLTADSVRQLCDRHFGIGSDGLIRITKGRETPFYMDYWNPDGSRAEMCGNGVRTLAKWLGDRGHVDESFDLETEDGIKTLVLSRGADGNVETVTVDMGVPRFDDKLVDEVIRGGQAFHLSQISMGNPHAVIFVDDIDEVVLETIGPLIQGDTRHFPEGVNVEFVDVQANGNLRQRTFERGAGETLACGTGACAVAVAAQRRGMAGERVRIELRGGTLDLEWKPGGSVMMTGPAVEVFNAMLDPAQYGIALRA